MFRVSEHEVNWNRRLGPITKRCKAGVSIRKFSTDQRK